MWRDGLCERAPSSCYRAVRFGSKQKQDEHLPFGSFPIGIKTKRFPLRSSDFPTFTELAESGVEAKVLMCVLSLDPINRIMAPCHHPAFSHLWTQPKRKKKSQRNNIDKNNRKFKTNLLEWERLYDRLAIRLLVTSICYTMSYLWHKMERRE